MRRTDHPAYELWYGAKRRARDGTLMFDLELDDIIIPDTCPALGIPLRFMGRVTENTPTLDRIIPELGYTKGNVIVVSMKANWCKSNLTVGQLIQMAEYFRTLLSSKEPK